MRAYISDWWRIDLADGWEVQLDESCTTICQPRGVGSLQISAYQKAKGKFTREELLELADFDARAREHSAEGRWGDFRGFYLAYSEESRFWRNWWLASGPTMAYVTYNCRLKDREIERQAVNAMVESLSRADA